MLTVSPSPRQFDGAACVDLRISPGFGGTSGLLVDIISDIGAVVDVRYKSLYRVYYKPAVHIHG